MDIPSESSLPRSAEEQTQKSQSRWLQSSWKLNSEDFFKTEQHSTRHPLTASHHIHKIISNLTSHFWTQKEVSWGPASATSRFLDQIHIYRVSQKKVPFWNFGFTNPCDNYGPTKQTKLFYEMVMYLYCVLLNPTFLEAQSELSAGGAMGDVENTPKCTCLNCIPGLAPRSCLLGLAGRRSALWWSWWRWPWWWQWWWHTCSYSANDGIWRYQVCRVPILCVCTSAG